MKQKHFDATLAVIDGNCNRIMGYKNDNLYAKDTADRLHNFKIGAEISGFTPAQIAWGYMTKHSAALRDMVLRNDFSNPDELLEKCTDMINYLRFIYCIGMEAYEEQCKQECQEAYKKEEVAPSCPPYKAMNKHDAPTVTVAPSEMPHAEAKDTVEMLRRELLGNPKGILDDDGRRA